MLLTLKHEQYLIAASVISKSRVRPLKEYENINSKSKAHVRKQKNNKKDNGNNE